ASDLGTIAANKALKNAGLTPNDIDLIIVATITPDMNFPSTACIIQHNLGAVKAAAFDLEAACSGFLYALNVASQFIMNGSYENILVIGTECMSRITN